MTTREVQADLQLSVSRVSLQCKFDEVRGGSAAVRDTLEQGGDSMEYWAAGLNLDLALQQLEACNKLISELELALGGIHVGTYGSCSPCEQATGAGRRAVGSPLPYLPGALPPKLLRKSTQD